jgi:hypothetical protein
MKTKKPSLIKLDSKSMRKMRPVRIPCGCLHAQCVCLFNKTEVEDPRKILDRLHDTKSALKTIVSCDRVFDI